LTIIAASSAARSPFAPDVPTLKESGIVADAWYGMWLPAGSPEFSSELSAAAIAALAKPEVKLAAIGLIPVGSTADGLAQELAYTTLWQPIVKVTGYKIDN
jgi:tripartite-type tricarboxylate transporter receptor subunit TctC